MPKARKRKKANAKRGWSRNKRLDDLYDRLDLARSLPPEAAVRICKTIVNDSILDDDAALEDTTGVRPETFGVHLDALKTALDADADSPLYYGRPGRDADAGRRSRLQPAHRLLMYLESRKQGASQRYLAARYGVSQPTVSRCIEHTENALAEFAATADNIHDRIDMANTVAKLQAVLYEAVTYMLRLAQAPEGLASAVPKTLPHNRLLRDGFHTPKCRPSNKGERDTTWSGKKKAHTLNTVLEANEYGISLGMSGCWPGSWHDMRVQQIEEVGEEENGGILTRCLLGKSNAMLIYEYGDKGFQGLQAQHPGAVVRTPPKKKRGKKLTKTELEEGKRINRVRIPIEHTNGRMKRFACMRNKFFGGSEKLRKTANVLSGFVNYHLATGMPDPKNTNRKKKKPGPKTYRTRWR